MEKISAFTTTNISYRSSKAFSKNLFIILSKFDSGKAPLEKKEMARGGGGNAIYLPAKAAKVIVSVMNKMTIILLLLLLSFQTPFSQTKGIIGDTTYWFKSNVELQQYLGLKNFGESSDEFNFRFRNHGQILEISKELSIYSGSITNYIYHTKKGNRNKTETLSGIIMLSSKQAEDIYYIIQKSGILDLPSDRNIENWKFGSDGITYVVEHSDKNNYWFKSYWTPSSQDSIPEALIVQELVKRFYEILDLQKKYSSFKNTLPRKGCYNSGGMTTMCYISNNLELGYSGATKLPLGFYSTYNATYLGRTKVNSSLGLQYNFDHAGFNHLNFQIAKWKLFLKESGLSDFLVYNYQNRKLNIDKAKSKFENHQIKYGLNLKNNLGLAGGLDYISGKYEKIGGCFYAQKWFSKSKISSVLTTSIFDHKINYKVELFKSFDFNNKLTVRSISFGTAYEDFLNYKDLYFGCRVSL